MRRDWTVDVRYRLKTIYNLRKRLRVSFAQGIEALLLTRKLLADRLLIGFLLIQVMLDAVDELRLILCG